MSTINDDEADNQNKNIKFPCSYEEFETNSRRKLQNVEEACMYVLTYVHMNVAVHLIYFVNLIAHFRTL